jgi:thiol-disulfide isomerase/thioredoxin
MSTTAVIATLLALVTLSTVLGLAWRHRQGRVRHTDGRTVVRPAELPGVRRLARGATLLQFSTRVCAPCVPTRAVLGALASERSQVTHVDLDVTDRPDLASRFNILQTPTTLVLDRKGVVRARIGGPPRRAELAAELDRILEAA